MKQIKVSDRVAVYGHEAARWERVTGTVLDPSSPRVSGTCRVEIRLDSGKGNVIYADPRQCRKLVKKPRRRIWLCASAFDEVTDCNNFSCLSNNPQVFTVRHDLPGRLKHPGEELIEFVEVRRK